MKRTQPKKKKDDAAGFVKVESSNIEAVRYDFHKADLYIRFKGGTVYVYRMVEPDVYERFKESDSPGTFLSGVIKPHYKAEKVVDDSGVKD